MSTTPTFSGSRSSRNPFYRHVEQFRDAWLEVSPDARLSLRDIHCAYDEWCRIHAIVNRKLERQRLPAELAQVGVILGSYTEPSGGVGVIPTRRFAYLGWRLNRNCRYAIRNALRPRVCDHYYGGYVAVGPGTGDASGR